MGHEWLPKKLLPIHNSICQLWKIPPEQQQRNYNLTPMSVETYAAETSQVINHFYLSSKKCFRKTQSGNGWRQREKISIHLVYWPAVLDVFMWCCHLLVFFLFFEFDLMFFVVVFILTYIKSDWGCSQVRIWFTAELSIQLILLSYKCSFKCRNILIGDNRPLLYCVYPHHWVLIVLIHGQENYIYYLFL